MKRRAVALIVDDDLMTRRTLAMALADEYATLTAGNGREALAMLAGEEVDIVLTDLDMPEMNGIELLAQINGSAAPKPVIIITGQGTIETAVQAMKVGAGDYVTKPVNIDRLVLLIEKTLEHKRLQEENLLLKRKIRESLPDFNLIGNSEEMKKIAALALQVAGTRATVLIEGESGTGKELVTNFIHYNSPVVDGPLIKVNCAALADGVLESELFGHEKGAFTGAIAAKKGRFELADGGTLFLDEVGEMPPATQVKLLRFLQEKEFERVGGNKTIRIEVRIIAATNKNLEGLIKEGKFREDLYYRLRVVKMIMPPLRKRKDDIPILIRSFVDKFSKIHGKPVSGVAAEVLRLAQTYDWPGNVRELANCIESSVVMARHGVIDMDCIPEYLAAGPGEAGADGEGGLLQEMERKMIVEVLQETGGDKTRAARKLGIGLRTLYRKMERWQLHS
jgi:DNA-binding NtrC family response regulator